MTTTFANQTSSHWPKQSGSIMRTAIAMCSRSVRFIGQEFARRRAIAHMAELDDHLMRDIGISYGEIQAVVYGRTMPASHRSTRHDRFGF